MFDLIKTIINLLNINNKEKIKEEKYDETNIKYIYINKNMILDGVKYEIGKRYHSEIEFKNNIYDFNSDLLANMRDYKIIKIKIFDDEIFTTKNFKIIKEINYKQFLNSRQLEYQLISIVKNKEEKLIKNIVKVFDTDCIISSYMADAIINSGLHKYLDKLLDFPIRNQNQHNNLVNKIIETYGRNKDLDKYVHNYYSVETFVNIGRNKDLDSFSYWEDNIICAVLKNGRYRDVKHFLRDKNCNYLYAMAIVETGIDRYIKTFLYDNLLQCHGYELHIIQEIAKHCSKKDLDYIIDKYKEDLIKMQIAERGYDDHIELLLSEKNCSDIKEMAYHLIK